MRIALSTIGRFHTFDLARELHARGHELTVFTGYPRFKLRDERLPQSAIRTFPWLHAPCMKLGTRLGYDRAIMRELVHWNLESFGRHVTRNIPECDVYSGLSSSAGDAGRIVKSRGAGYICDRGSSHIRIQDQILSEEHARWGLKYKPIDPRVIAREEREYEEADLITVPSSFAYRSFVDAGVPERKLRLIPYGVDLTRFQKVAEPPTDSFEVLFVGGVNIRKGIPYLLQAFAKLTHRAKRLTIVGGCDPAMLSWLHASGLPLEGVTLTGSVPQPQLKAIMSRAHVMVLPSVEEGLALVQAQALACGCPVIGTHNSGGEDLFTDGEEGYIVPIRDAVALAERMQNLADQPWLQQMMGAAALLRVRRIGGWSTYGGRVAALMEDLATHRRRDAGVPIGALAGSEIGSC